MKKELALWTENAWHQGLLHSRAERELFCHSVLNLITEKRPLTRVDRNRALSELRDQVEVTFLKLSYGRPFSVRSLAPVRQELLRARASARLDEIFSAARSRFRDSLGADARPSL